MIFDVYKEIEMISCTDEKDIILVRHEISKRLFIKKIIHNCKDMRIYELLKKQPHPNIASIYETYIQGDTITLIEEYINGVTLEYALSASPFSYEEILHTMLQVLDAVEFLHQCKPPIIHRDIKPGNLMMVKGKVKLIDFEIARLFKEHQNKDTQVIGSPGYAAPEQYGFHQSDERSDIYALGVVLMNMCEHSYEPKKVTERFSGILKCCMELDPVNRYQSINAMRAAFPYSGENSNRTLKQLGIFIPGFAKESIPSKIFIFGYYVFLLFLTINVPFTNTSLIDHILMRFAVFLVFLSLLWIPKNFGNILAITPFYHSSHFLIKICNVAFIWVFFSSAVLLVAAFSAEILDTIITII